MPGHRDLTRSVISVNKKMVNFRHIKHFQVAMDAFFS